MAAPNVIDLRRPPRRLWSWGRIGLWIALVLVGLAGAAGAAFAIWLYWPRPANLTSVTGVEHLISRHMILPAGEQPELATVTDASKLQTPFLRQARNGDKLLVYEKAGEAILYRPGIDRIVAVGPVDIQPAPAAATP